MFQKDKKYKFSFEKYRIDCAKNQVPMGDWGSLCDGATVHVKDDLTVGIIYGYTGPPQIMIENGFPVQGRPTECRLIESDWCIEEDL